MRDEKVYDVVPVPVDSGALVVSRAPEEVLAEAKRAAEALTAVIQGKKKPVIFNGEQYLEFEDWQTVGKFYGVTVRVVSTSPVSMGEVHGFEAKADVLDVRTGHIVSSAEAMCLNDEPNWAKKPLFQLRSMAQTRACAKAFRNVLAWVVVLAGYRPTPAEEVPPEGFPAASNGKSEGKPDSATPKPAGVKIDARIKSKYDNAKCGFCGERHITKGQEIVKVGEKWGDEKCLSPVGPATEAAPEAKDGPPTNEQVARLDKHFAAQDTASQDFWYSFKETGNSQFTAAEAQKWIDYFENPDLQASVDIDAFLSSKAKQFGLVRE